MKQMLTAKELVTYLDKKTAQLDGAIIIKQLYPIHRS
jgi:DNA integrity scanning protein DisA with diadenylate cyclase activity